MLYEILQDPRTLLEARTASAIQVLNVHRPIPEQVPVGHFEHSGAEVVDEVVSRNTYLDRIQQVANALGDRFELRFYDHFEEEFDASVLDELPAIRRLSIDGLDMVRNSDAIGRLPHLEHLTFGPRHLANVRILSDVGIERLTHFTLAGTPSPAIDLAPLANARSLISLRLLGHGKNTQAAGQATSLRELALQPSAKFGLEFINRLVGLDSLKLVLGGTASIAAIEGLPVLRDLSFREVRHLTDLGDLQRFPHLRRLQVSDQPKITELYVGPRNLELEHVYLYSLPALRALHGFSQLPAVKSLFAYDTNFALQWQNLPTTLTHLQLLTKSVRGREAHAAAVRGKGLQPELHPDAVFFYK